MILDICTNKVYRYLYESSLPILHQIIFYIDTISKLKHRYIIFTFSRGGEGNLTGTSGDIGAENWDMRGFSYFF